MSCHMSVACLSPGYSLWIPPYIVVVFFFFSYVRGSAALYRNPSLHRSAAKLTSVFTVYQVYSVMLVLSDGFGKRKRKILHRSDNE
ncbi:hypothetical protein SAY86_001387 [Trapa natans]|uniref:Uncharacterized protein n=1 Tax=Trapa natans TaxID=22666 RepID=A0AAN7MCL9_TRANT|nr:hypothetical protein SAY86_001387 [Trapa natans]